jgi:hypothetical protein
VRHLLADGGEAIADLTLLRDQREVYGPVASTLTVWRRIFGEPCGPGLAIELHEALDPLAPHLAPAGREAILLQGARIALADGPYTPAERGTLAAVGAALTICADEVTRLLTAARRRRGPRVGPGPSHLPGGGLILLRIGEGWSLPHSRR